MFKYTSKAGWGFEVVEAGGLFYARRPDGWVTSARRSYNAAFKAGLADRWEFHQH